MSSTSLSISGKHIVIFTHNDFNEKKVIAEGSFEKLENEIRKRNFKHILVEGGDEEARQLGNKIMKILEKRK